MRVGRRQLVVLLAASFVASLGFLVAALIHDGSGVGQDNSRVVQKNSAGPGLETESASPRLHAAIEAGLWVGFGLTLGVFAAAAWLFRREVRAEKARSQSVVQKRQLLRQVEAYERVRRRMGPRPNN